MDNASDDGTAAWLQTQRDIRTLRNDVNAGFTRACNQGLAAAEGDCLLLLNNDVLVTPRWLDQLHTALYSGNSVGAVGPVTNAASYYSSLQVSYRSTEEMTGFAESYNHSDPGKWEERLKLIAFCLMMKREVYEQVGPLDERFAPGNVEDDDYSLRVRMAGYRLLLCTDTFVHDWIAESARVLKPGGLFFVSTPNRRTTNPGLYYEEAPQNPFHFFEFTLSEFVGELLEHYDLLEVYGQSLVRDQDDLAHRYLRQRHGRNLLWHPNPSPQVSGRELVPLGQIKNAQPDFVVALCRKK